MPMLNYRYDETALTIEETDSGSDVEFLIRITREEPYVERMRAVRHVYDDDEHYTDVLIHVYPNHEYRVQVTKASYNAFIAELFKHKLLQSLAWPEHEGGG